MVIEGCSLSNKHTSRQWIGAELVAGLYVTIAGDGCWTIKNELKY